MNIRIGKSNLSCLLSLSAVALLLLGACQSENQISYARYYTSGKQLYDRHCQNCHSQDGTGLKGLIPPLTDTTFLSKNKGRLACIIKYGMHDTISVNGREYNSEMPGNSSLPDIDIAAIVTYITNSFGNKQGLYRTTDASEDLSDCPSHRH